jgi:hypothetical protein
MIRLIPRSCAVLSSLLLTVSLWLPTVATPAAGGRHDTRAPSARLVIASASPIVLM